MTSLNNLLFASNSPKLKYIQFPKKSKYSGTWRHRKVTWFNDCRHIFFELMNPLIIEVSNKHIFMWANITVSQTDRTICCESLQLLIKVITIFIKCSVKYCNWLGLLVLDVGLESDMLDRLQKYRFITLDVFEQQKSSQTFFRLKHLPQIIHTMWGCSLIILNDPLCYMNALSNRHQQPSAALLTGQQWKTCQPADGRQWEGDLKSWDLSVCPGDTEQNDQPADSGWEN